MHSVFHRLICQLVTILRTFGRTSAKAFSLSCVVCVKLEKGVLVSGSNWRIWSSHFSYLCIRSTTNLGKRRGFNEKYVIEHTRNFVVTFISISKPSCLNIWNLNCGFTGENQELRYLIKEPKEQSDNDIAEKKTEPSL